MPFKIDLKPGEFLTRVQPYPIQPPWSGGLYEQRRSPLRTYRDAEESVPSYPRAPVGEDIASRQWSPEQLYENAVDVDITGAFKNPMERKSGRDTRAEGLRRPSPASDGKRQSVRFEDDQVVLNMRDAQRHQPLQPASSNSSIYSDVSHGSRALAPTGADRFRPKKIIMPAPLQFQSRSQENLPRHNLTPSRSVPSLQRAATMQPVAAQIPMHDQKKGNLLKKRASLKPPSQKHLPNQEYPGASSTSIFTAAKPTGGPEEKLPKVTRKLSKRRT